jgi:hypothetical protein
MSHDVFFKSLRKHRLLNLNLHSKASQEIIFVHKNIRLHIGDFCRSPISVYSGPDHELPFNTEQAFGKYLRTRYLYWQNDYCTLRKIKYNFLGDDKYQISIKAPQQKSGHLSWEIFPIVVRQFGSIDTINQMQEWRKSAGA